MRDDINERLCELLGICWHEQVDDQTLQCKHCGAPMLFPWHQNPDFTSEYGRIDLLRRMLGRDDWKSFLACLIGYKEPFWYAEPIMIKLFLTEVICNDTGSLAREAVEFLTKEAEHDCKEN